MKTIIRSILFASTAFYMQVVFAEVIAGFDGTSYSTADAAGDTVAPPSGSLVGVTVDDMIRTDTGGKASFSSAGGGSIFWRTDFTGSTLENSIAANLFFQFSVSVNDGYELSLDTLTFNFGATQTTTTKVDLPVVTYLQMSTDGGSSFATVGSTNVTVTVAQSDHGVDAGVLNTATLTVDLSSYTELTNDVLFRVGGYLQRYNNSLRYIRGGDITLNGTVTAEILNGGSADIIVYQASPGGICSAIAAAREGVSVKIITPYSRIGGIEANGGLVNSDQGPVPDETIGGLRKEFHQRIAAYYLDTYGAESRQVERATKGGYPGGRFEPKVAEMIHSQMLAEYSSIDPVVFGQELVAVEKADGKITAVICEDLNQPGVQIRYEGKIFIDASYAGDLLARSGAGYYCGREPREMYSEPHAGIRAGANVGDGDSAVQSYNYRMTTTRVESNAVPVIKPDNYDDNLTNYYASSKSKFAKVLAGEDAFWHPEWAELPNEKFDTNIGDMLEVGHPYSEGNRDLRNEIEQVQRDYSIGYLWFLQNDPLTPDAVKEQFSGLGFAKDEFPENGNFPVELYVREGRRLIGEYVLSEYDLVVETDNKSDSVCLGSYDLDCHACAWMRNADGTFMLDADGDKQAEGYVGGEVEPYEIPFRVLLPQKDECENLLVPVCASVTHVAWTSVRMEPIFSMMGEAAGIAAALAIESDVSVQDINVDSLQLKLKSYDAVLDADPRSGGFMFSVVSNGGENLVVYDYTSYFNASGSGTGPDGLAAPAATSSSNLTVSSIYRGGVTPNFSLTACGSVYWSTAGTPDSETESVEGGDWLEFSVHMNEGLRLNCSSLSFEFGGSDSKQNGAFTATAGLQIDTGEGFDTVATKTIEIEKGAANTNVRQETFIVDLNAPEYQGLLGDVGFRLAVWDNVNDLTRYVRAQEIVLKGHVY